MNAGFEVRSHYFSISMDCSENVAVELEAQLGSLQRTRTKSLLDVDVYELEVVINRSSEHAVNNASRWLSLTSTMSAAHRIP